MINKRKRKLAVSSSVFAFILALVFFVLNAFIIVGKITGSGSTGYENSILYTLNFAPFATIQDCVNEYNAIFTGSLDYALFAGLALIGLVLFILAICNFKKPIRKDGTVKNRGFLMFLQFIFACAIVAGAIISIVDATAPFKNVENNAVVNYLLYGYIAFGGLTVLFTIFSAFCKKVIKEKALTREEIIDRRVDKIFNGNQEKNVPVVKADAVAINVNNKSEFVDSENVSPIVKVIEEKIVRVNQLKERGIITEAQYNAAIARLINSI